jgi:3-oxoacyl-[acyl-carrier protein] reductase
MDLNLKGKRAVVCGSTQGIGKASAMELALLGASITLVARNEEKLKAALNDLPQGEGQHHGYLVADFTDRDGLANVLDQFTREYIAHILVNNTGGPPGGPVFDAKLDEFIAAFSAHLLCNQISGMKREGYGRIINVISTSVKIPIKGLGVSNTIRGAVANWSKTLSSELASFGITVNNVLPGASMTGRLESIIKSKSEKTGKSTDETTHEMIAEIPAGRISSPSEIAAAIAFLATPAAGYINGINLPVDGGRTGSL